MGLVYITHVKNLQISGQKRYLISVDAPYKSGKAYDMAHSLFRLVIMDRPFNGRDRAIMEEQVNLSRVFIDNELVRLYPNHVNWFHMHYRGDYYHFYVHRNQQANRPPRLTMNLAVNAVHNELFEIQEEGQDVLMQYFMPDGSLAARIQMFQMNLDLENMPNVQRIYKHWLFYGFEHPQISNTMVILG